MFDEAGEKDYYDLLKKRAVTMLDAIIAGKENPESDAQELTIKILTYIAPKKYIGSDGMEIQYDRQFENLCLILSEQLHTNPKRMTVLEFYNALEFLQERAKEQAKNARKGRR